MTRLLKLAVAAILVTHNIYSQDVFNVVVLVEDISDPTQMSVAMDGRIYYARRTGTIHVFDPNTSQHSEVGQVDTDPQNEAGLGGIALHPDFLENNHLFLYYNTLEGNTKSLGLYRYTLTDEGTLDMASEINLLTFSLDRVDHSSGGLIFSPNGDLFISVGDDTYIFGDQIDGFSPMDERQGADNIIRDAQRTAGNSRDHRGSILRIHPEPDGSYTIPDGNLFDNPDDGLPEIFTMGNRNPFRASVDPLTGWLYWGEPGPNQQQDSPDRGPRGHDEFNLAKSAGNYGWPYFIGPNKPYQDYDYETGANGEEFDVNSPVNQSPNNTGIENLPPPQSALVWYSYNSFYNWEDFGTHSTNCAMAGPLYRFNANHSDESRLPLKYDNSLIIFDWGRTFIKAVKLNSAGEVLDVFPMLDASGSLPFVGPMDVKLGPNGELYTLNWGSTSYPNNTGNGNLVKVEFVSGDPVFPGIVNTSRFLPVKKTASQTVAKIGAGWSLLNPGGYSDLNLYNNRGQKVWGSPLEKYPGRVKLPGHLPDGIYRAEFTPSL